MTSHPKDLSDELIEVLWKIEKNLQALASSVTVRQQPHLERDEPSLYERAVSRTGKENPCGSS